MAAKRLWVLIASAVLVSLAALSLARAADDSALAGDFLVLAIKPEGEVKDYRLVPVGETAVDPVQYRDIVKALPRSLFGGLTIRPHDERAELAQCRTACAANAKCGNFTYVRPGKDRPIGVCHLRRAIDTPTAVAVAPVVAAPVVAAPIVEHAAPAPELVVVSPPVRDERALVAVDSTRNGHALYDADEVPTTPVTFKFNAPVANAKVDVRTRGRARVWANVEALDAKGRVFKRTGTWVAADRASHQLLVRTERDRIGALRITTREAGALRVDGIDYTRVALVAEAEPADDDVAPAEEETKVPVPKPVDEAVATGAPADIVEPEQEVPGEVPGEVTVAELPPAMPETAIRAPAVPTVEAPAEVTPIVTPIPVPEEQPRPLPLWAAAGAVAFMLGGAGLYRQNHRRRTLLRLTTTVVSEGLDRQTVFLSADEADLSLRFSVRMHAAVDARQTTITITPDGDAA